MTFWQPPHHQLSKVRGNIFSFFQNFEFRLVIFFES
jgi:hypothetical protein